MKIALYKGRQRLISKIICYWTQSPYSHCELVFSDGLCGSSHDLDLGVRLKKIDFHPEHWDFIEIDGDEVSARHWFEKHSKEPYDYLGLLSFIFPIKNNQYKWTCVKAVLTALGYEDAWRFEPSMLPAMIKGGDKNDLLTNTNPGVEPVAIFGPGVSPNPLGCKATCKCIPGKGCGKGPCSDNTKCCGSANCAVCSSADWMEGQ